MRGHHPEDAAEFEIDGVRFVSSFVDRDFPRPIYVDEAGVARGALRESVARVRATPHGGARHRLRRQPGVVRPAGETNQAGWLRVKANRNARLDGSSSSGALATSSARITGWTRPIAITFGRPSLPSSAVSPSTSSLTTLRIATLPRLRPSRRCFPLTRPGGLSVIEDWAGLHERAELYNRRLAQPRSGKTERLAARIAERIESGVGAETPLSRLAIEFMLVQASDDAPDRGVDRQRALDRCPAWSGGAIGDTVPTCGPLRGRLWHGAAVGARQSRARLGGC